MKFTQCQIFLIVLCLCLLYVMMCENSDESTEHFKKSHHHSDHHSSHHHHSDHHNDHKHHSHHHHKHESSLPRMPAVWNRIINEISGNIDAFHLIPYEQQKNIHGHIQKLMTHYELDTNTTRSYSLITTADIVGKTASSSPKTIPHTAIAGTLSDTPYSYIKALHLIHKIDNFTSNDKSEYDETSKYVETKNFANELSRSQDALLASLRRSIGK